MRQFVLEARRQTARLVDAGLTLLYWQIGDRIRREILSEKRAGYGERIVSALGEQLESEFGRGFSEKSLRHMIRFAETFPDMSIVSTLSRQLAWSHFMEIIYLKNDLQRSFYAELCRMERWSVRLLRSRIQSMLYERTALSKKPDHLIEKELKGLVVLEKVCSWSQEEERQVIDTLTPYPTYKDSGVPWLERVPEQRFCHSRASGNPGLLR